MRKYSVVVSKSAEKELNGLPANVILRVIEIIKSFEQNPRPIGCKKLRGYKDLWRIRIGVYRVVYSIDDKILIVDIRRVEHRKGIYR